MAYNINFKRVKCNPLWVLLPTFVYAHVLYSIYQIPQKSKVSFIYYTQRKQTVQYNTKYNYRTQVKRQMY